MMVRYLSDPQTHPTVHLVGEIADDDEITFLTLCDAF
jgi:hypothetical protein